MHNLFCNNCHSHVAYVLNLSGDEKKWNMVSVWWVLIWKGKYLGCSGFVKTYFWFVILVTVVFLVSFLSTYDY